MLQLVGVPKESPESGRSFFARWRGDGAVQVHSRGAQCVGAGVGVQSCLLRQGAHALPVLCLHITSDLNRQFCFGVVSVGLNGRNSRDPVTCACPRLLKQALP